MNEEFRPLNKKKTPSRAECEAIIRRILTTETSARTVNATFKRPSDFMGFFESLYTPSAALTKQVQRAIKSLDMAKDANGYYILNKSKEQSNQDNIIRSALSDAHYSVNLLDNASNLFLALDRKYIDFVMETLAESITFKPYIITMFPCYNGLLIVTNDKEKTYDLLTNINL
ncbi:MAG: hypothetical protein E7241_10575 [Lachnospiraceae bacterium]|nr:hypothetical protein [Lachnospiraceae bacterium]